jgi:outer membrane receptor protein involved in Fe transport
MIRFRMLVLVATVMLAVASMNAQVTGRITGSVVDQTGAGVPDAMVSLQLPGSTAAVITTKTTASGDFAIATVNAGLYDLAVEAKGFAKTVVGGLKVDPGRSADVPPIKLEVAGVTQTVEVSEARTSVQTSNAEVASTVTRSQIEDLPVLDRNPLAILQTQVGVGNGQGDVTINGLRVSYLNVTLDGINIQDNFGRGNSLAFNPNLLALDQVSEVTVSTSNVSSAAAGGAGQVAFTTPSGTNQYHGKVYFQNRNSALAANSFFNNSSGVKVPFLNQNQMGAAVGGRIIKDKLFFYVNYEAYRQHQQTNPNRSILTATARQGIFTYRSTAGVVNQVNILQAMGLQPDTVMAGILSAMPGADKINNFRTGDSSATLLRNSAGYQFAVRDNRLRDNLSVRGDYVPSTKHQISFTYAWNRDILDRPDADVTYHVVPTVQNDDHVRLVSTAWRWNPQTSLTNEVRFGFNIAPAVFIASQDIPQYFVTGLFTTNPVNTFRSQGRNVNTYQFMDNAAWIKGKHNLQFGFQWQYTLVPPYNDAGITPSYALGIGTGGNVGLSAAQMPGIGGTDLSSANSLLATLAGYYSSASQTFNVTSRTSGYVNGATSLRNYQLYNYAGYLQDAWRIVPRLTATLGVRYDYYAPVNERDSLALLPVLQNGNAIQTLLSNATLDFAGNSVGRSAYKSDKNNFAPSVGLAWDIFGDGTTAVRAGYSINYVNDQFVAALQNNLNTNAGLSSSASLTNLAGRLANGVPAVPTPLFKVPRTFADNFALNPSANAEGMPDPNLVVPYVQTWNVGVERSVRGTLINLRYVGNHATKQIRGIDFNQVLLPAAYMTDFKNAQSNGFLSQAATGVFRPAYNANIAGSKPLPLFATMPSGGLLTNATIINEIQTGQVGDLASVYFTNGLAGPVNFFTNPYGLGMNMLTNYSNSTFNALQLDVARRFKRGFQFQANYQFSRNFSDSGNDTPGTVNTNFEALLDNNNPKAERSRVSAFDLTHVFKANGVYELPLGPGHKLNYAPLARVLGGWSVSSIFTWQSGTPFSITSGSRGTLNRAGRSANNTVDTTLNKGQLDQLFQVRVTGSGVYYVPASIIGPDGRAVAADGQPPFAGQVFTNPVAGTIGSLQRNYFSGPSVWDVDFKIGKLTKITESKSLELRMEATNFFNHTTWYVGNNSVNSTAFGQITSQFYGNRLIQFAGYFRF